MTERLRQKPGHLRSLRDAVKEIVHRCGEKVVQDGSIPVYHVQLNIDETPTRIRWYPHINEKETRHPQFVLTQVRERGRFDGKIFEVHRHFAYIPGKRVLVSSLSTAIKDSDGNEHVRVGIDEAIKSQLPHDFNETEEMYELGEGEIQALNMTYKKIVRKIIK